MESTDSEEEREKLRKEEEAARRARSNAGISARKQVRREYTTQCFAGIRKVPYLHSSLCRDIQLNSMLK